VARPQGRSPRGISDEEAERIGLVDRVTEPGRALAVSLELAQQLSALPQAAPRSDRLSATEQWGLDWQQATLNEFRLGIAGRCGTHRSRRASFCSGRWSTRKGRLANTIGLRCVARKSQTATIDTETLRTLSPAAVIEPKCNGHLQTLVQFQPEFQRSQSCGSAASHFSS
jgi:hypothetical protein